MIVGLKPARAACVALLCIWFSHAPTAQSGHWPSFRGTNATGVADGQNLPLSWDTAKGVNIVWKTPIPGLGHSSPIVWGDRVFVTTAISANPHSTFRRDVVARHGEVINIDSSKDLSLHQWRVFGLDRRTGAVLWVSTAHEGVPKTDRHMKNSHASSTPTTDGTHVVALFGSEGLYCYDVNGRLLWKQNLGVLDAGSFDDGDFQWGTASSPVIHKNLVIVQCDIQTGSFIAAFDIDTGAEVWRTRRDESPSWSTPTVYQGKSHAELITNATKFMRGYDPMNGKELWRLAGGSENVAPTPVAGDDTIFVTSGYRPIQPIYAIRPGAQGDISLTDGSTMSEHIVWSTKRGGPYIPTPIVYRGILYVLTNNGVLSAYTARTGERLYQQRLADTGGAYAASPVAADGRLYLTSEDGDVFVVKAGGEYELLAHNRMDAVCLATPAISHEMMFIRTQHHLFAIADRDRPRASADRHINTHP